MNHFAPWSRLPGFDEPLGDPYETFVDGELWVVQQRLNEPGTYEFKWVSGPNKGYGFTSATSDGAALTTAEVDESIREFLAGIDPLTGYLAED